MLYKYLIILTGLLFVLQTTGCKNRCDIKSDNMKCQDNKVYSCEGPGIEFADRWVEKLDCNKYGATCTAGDFSVEFSYSDIYFDPEKWDHMCVVDDIKCTGDTEEQCSKDGVLGLTCDYNIIPPVAVITSENEDTEQYPICVEKEDGTVGYSNYPGTCDFVGGTFCENGEYLKCIEGGLVLQMSALHPYCDCINDTDSSGQPFVYCDYTVPCDETTGEYSLCSDGDTAMFLDKCIDAGNVWGWGRNECSPTVPNCVMDGDVAKCVK